MKVKWSYRYRAWVEQGAQKGAYRIAYYYNHRDGRWVRCTL